MKISIFFIIFISAKTYAGNFVILENRHAYNLLNQCSRATPHAQSSWTPKINQIIILESHFDKLSKIISKGSGIKERLNAPPQSFHRQYVGLIIHGRKYIYINASKHYQKNFKKPIIVCDGGKDYWGALYDPITHEFSQLIFNGDS